MTIVKHANLLQQEEEEALKAKGKKGYGKKPSGKMTDDLGEEYEVQEEFLFEE